MEWTLLAILLAGTTASVVAHEGAHVWMGTRLGWEYKGLMLKIKLGGVGVRLEPNGNDRHLWRVAAAGPLATLACIGLFGLADRLAEGAAGAVMHSLFTFNVFLLAINLLPLRVTDGALILRGWRNR
jgi:Zn-dependent protease